MRLLTEEEILRHPLLENKTKELKESVDDRTIETTVAFLNEEGGYIIIGVKDDGTEKGIKDLDLAQRTLQEKINQCISPDPILKGLIEICASKFKRKDIIQVCVKKASEKFFYKGYIIYRQEGKNKKVTEKSQIIDILSKEIDEYKYWDIFIEKLKSVKKQNEDIDKSIKEMNMGNVPTYPIYRYDYSLLEEIFPFIRQKIIEEGILEDYYKLIELLKRADDAIYITLTNFERFYVKNPDFLGRTGLIIINSDLTRLIENINNILLLDLHIV